MAEGKLCVCPQCGKKYKLKAGFDAASFSCKACGATVWVEGKAPARAPGTRRKSRRGRDRGGRAKAEGADEGRRGRYQKQSNSTAVVLAIFGGLIVIGGIVFFVMQGGDEPPPADTGTTMAGQPDEADTGTTPTGASPIPTDASNPGGVTPPVPVKETGTPADEPKTDEPAVKEADPDGPTRELGGTPKKSGKPRRGKSRWDPPADLGHLKDTPPALRKQIDELVGLMMDPMAGRDSLDAKSKLAAIGKPAFLPILGAMAKIRDTITDVDSMDERLIESSLKLGDECLREMDGYLESKGKQPIRPGTDKKYIAYILRLHYRRWKEYLHDKPEMPGAYDPTQEYDEEGDPGEE